MPAFAFAHPFLGAALFLTGSNLCMTVAWYGHLKRFGHRPGHVAALLSWGIALFEYLLQVPGNRIGLTARTLTQRRIMRKVFPLVVFVPFAALYRGQALDYLCAGLGFMGAVYFIFRS